MSPCHAAATPGSEDDSTIKFVPKSGRYTPSSIGPLDDYFRRRSEHKRCSVSDARVASAAISSAASAPHCENQTSTASTPGTLTHRGGLSGLDSGSSSS